MDVLRSIGMILVVLGHVSQIKALNEWIYSFHMPLFFFSSGWLYCKRGCVSDIRRRAARIVVPYLLFSTIVLVYWVLVERHFRMPERTVLESVLGIVLGHYDLLAFNVHLWFLPCFFVVAVVYNILRNLWKQRTVLFISAGITMAAMLLPVPEMIWGVNRAALYIGYFALGDCASEWGIKTGQCSGNKTRKMLAGCMLWLLVFFLMPLLKKAAVLEILAALLGTAGSIAISMALEESRLLQYLGKTTLVVLCVHGPIYRILVKVCAMITHLGTDYLRQDILYCLLITGITCALCVAGYEILKRVAPCFLGMESKKSQ